MSKTNLCLFIPSNDSMVHWMLPIARRLNSSLFMILPQRNENADYALNINKTEYLHYKPGVLSGIRPSVIIFGNDWGREERQLILEARLLDIPSVCIQEGVILLQRDELMNADYIFAHGPEIQKYIRRDNVIITGNPKYDELKDIPFPETDKVLINCNFVYGILEDKREQWIKDVTSECQTLHLNYQISQHPRDKGKFPDDYPIIHSNAFNIKEQLLCSSILITRFSTLIYEALMAGRTVIYYNPYGENHRLMQEDYGAITIARNSTELQQSLHDATIIHKKTAIARQAFLVSHCGTINFDATSRCVDAINWVIKKDKHQASSIINTSQSFLSEYQQFIRYLDQTEDIITWQKSIAAIKERQIQELYKQITEFQNNQLTLQKQLAKKDIEFVSVLNNQIAESIKNITGLNLTLSEQDEEINNLNQALSERDKQINNLNQEFKKIREELTNTLLILKTKNEEISVLHFQNSQLSDKLLSQEISIQELINNIYFLREREKELEIIYQSKAWKIVQLYWQLAKIPMIRVLLEPLRYSLILFGRKSKA